MIIHVEALIWAAAMILVAAAARLGFVEERTATYLLLVIPVAAWLAISPRRVCAACPRAGG